MGARSGPIAAQFVTSHQTKGLVGITNDRTIASRRVGRRGLPERAAGPSPKIDFMFLPLVVALASSSPAAAARVDAGTRFQLPAAPAARAAVLPTHLRAAARARGLQLDPALAFELEARPGLGGTRPEIVTVHGTIDGRRLTRPVARLLVDGSGEVRLVTWHGAVPAVRPGVVALTASDAIAAVEATGWPGSAAAASAQLRVEPRGHESVWVWQVDPPFDRAGLSNRVFSVDAQTGEVRVTLERVSAAEVNAFFHNPISTPDAHIEPVQSIDAGATSLVGPRVVANNCLADPPEAMCNPAPKAVASTVGDFIYPTPDLTDPAQATAPEDEFAETSAYYYADKFDVWLQSFGQPGVPCQAEGRPLVVTANYRGENDAAFDNAFYTGDCNFTVFLGQGATADYAYDGDVVYHEVGHGVTFQQLGETLLFGRDLRPEGVVADGGGLSEGLADFWSAAYAQDPLVGDYTIARNNDNEFTCPADMPGQAHADSEVWAGALWEIYTTHGEVFVPAVFDGVAMFPSEPTYEEAAEAIVAVAFVELGEVIAGSAEETFTQRNLLSCERYAPYEEVDNGIWLNPPSWGDNFDPMRPPSFQISLLAPPDAVMAHVTFELGIPWEGASLDSIIYDANVLWNVGEPVEFLYEVSPGGIVHVDADPTAVYYDLAPDGVHGSFDVPVEGGREYYAAFFNLEFDPILLDGLDVQYDVEPAAGSTGEPPDETTGEVDGSADDTAGTVPGTTSGSSTETDTEASAGETVTEDGCACRAEPGTPRWAHALWLLALVRRRRNAQRRAARA
jgi:hypothetical protein